MSIPRKVELCSGAPPRHDMEGLISTLLILVVALLCGEWCRILAVSKGWGSTWFAAGLFFGPLGLIAAAGLPDLKLQRYLRAIAEHHDAIPTRIERM
jgi:hypothetical protein